MIVLLILLLIAAAAVCMQLVELTRFRTTEYELVTNKLRHPVRLAVLADLHGFSYGKGNKRLLKAVKAVRPDLILIAGDLIVTSKTETYRRGAMLCKELTGIAPVFFTFGNHETRALDHKIPEFEGLIRELERSGVILLNQGFSTEKVSEDEIFLYGLELPMEYYQKGKKNVLPPDYILHTLGPVSEEAFSVLLAHNPMFGDDYFAWGADLILSGHTHGGLVRFPGKGSLLSPELTFFPKYDGGHYEKCGKHLIVSKGLGTHTYHIRIFDRAELLSVTIRPQS